MSTDPPAAASSRRGPYEPGHVGRTVRDFLLPLQKGYLKDEAWTVARLAQLRRGAGKAPEEVPELFGLTGTEKLYTGEKWERDREHAPTAVHLTVTLYALHQQSQRAHPMNVAGHGLGGAVRALMPPGEIDEPIRRRFVRTAGATSAGVLAYRLRELVLLLRRAGQPLDYVRLADQIERALDPGRRLRVRQEWGRDFHTWRPPKNTDNAPPSDDGGTPATDQDTE